jgi:hypothetical protein
MQIRPCLFLLEKQFSENAYKPFADRKRTSWIQIGSLISSDFVMTSKRSFQKHRISKTFFFFCFGESIALHACGFQLGVQTQNIQRLHLYFLCSIARLRGQRWVSIFYTINYIVPKMHSGQMYDVLACSGCWIPQWVSLLIFNIFIMVTTTTTLYHQCFR